MKINIRNQEGKTGQSESRQSVLYLRHFDSRCSSRKRRKKKRKTLFQFLFSSCLFSQTSRARPITFDFSPSSSSFVFLVPRSKIDVGNRKTTKQDGCRAVAPVFLLVGEEKKKKKTTTSTSRWGLSKKKSETRFKKKWNPVTAPNTGFQPKWISRESLTSPAWRNLLVSLEFSIKFYQLLPAFRYRCLHC